MEKGIKNLLIGFGRGDSQIPAIVLAEGGRTDAQRRGDFDLRDAVTAEDADAFAVFVGRFVGWTAVWFGAGFGSIGLHKFLPLFKIWGATRWSAQHFPSPGWNAGEPGEMQIGRKIMKTIQKYFWVEL